MDLAGEHVLLRIYLQSADRAPHAPTWELIVKSARAHSLAGATAIQGIVGFGHQGLIRHKTFALVEHVPVILEIIDSPDAIVRFVEGPLEKLMGAGGMITLERAHVLMYRHRNDQLPNALEVRTMEPSAIALPNLKVSGQMKSNSPGVLLRIFIGESDRLNGKPLHEAILAKARELGIAGATAMRGVEGFGANSVVHKAHLLELSSDLPIVVEIVDAEEKIQALLPHLEQMVGEGLITMEDVQVLVYRHDIANSRG